MTTFQREKQYQIMIFKLFCLLFLVSPAFARPSPYGKVASARTRGGKKSFDDWLDTVRPLKVYGGKVASIGKSYPSRRLV
jgi:hypothetical protein